MRIRLKNAVIVPCLGDGRVHEGELIIEDGRIVEVHEGQSSSQADETRDLSGKTVLPGFIDLHAHLSFRRVVGPIWNVIRDPDPLNVVRSIRSALTLLRQGVTTIRELAAPNNINTHIKTAVDSGLMPGPRIISAGAPLSVTGGHAKAIAKIGNGPEAFRALVRENVEGGADWIKVISSNDPLHTPMEGEYSHSEIHADELEAVVETAHSLGRRVAVHTMGSDTCRMVAKAGVDTMEHGVYLTEEGAELMKQNQVTLVPTLSGYLETTFDRWDRGDQWIADHEHLVDAHRDSFELAVEHKVPIAFGTDSVGELVHELELMIAYGMSPEDAIQAATLSSARVLGLDAHIGSLEPGKLADICVIDGDPIGDIKALRGVHAVLQGGVWIEPLDVRLPSGDESGESEPWLAEMPALPSPVAIQPEFRSGNVSG